jgi:2-methylcitrate dehydratase PrpD
MNAETRIVDYICNTSFEEIPAEAVAMVRDMVRADIGTAIAGARAEGCEVLAEYCMRQGGAEEATILVHGGRVPAQNAALANAVMSRALDFCDAIAPGAHIGSSAIPVALACAELRGGCSGRDFLTALAIGIEVAARFNLTEAAYNGFDPTGVSVPFGAAAVASRLLGLDREQTWNALGIAFNRCGGSFQSNIDGTLSVRANQGWVAQDALTSARVAQLGFTGPRNFLEGIYGYLHLYGKGLLDAGDIVDGLGDEYRLMQMVFKKYPSCGMTQGPTEVILFMLDEFRLEPSDIAAVTLTLPPYGHRLVGHEFRIGDNPTVDGQFSAQYCVANVLLRGSSKIRHFSAESVRDPEIGRFIPMISVIADPELDKRGHTAMDMAVLTRNGTVHKRGLEIAPGFPGNPLSEEDHRRRFRDCLDYAGDWFDERTAAEVETFIMNIEGAGDVRDLVKLLAGDIEGRKASVA